MSIQLLLGDCLDILPTLPPKSVDMVLADLPYGTTACKWDSIIPLGQLWPEIDRVCKLNAAMVFTTAQPFTTTLAASNMKNFRYEWIWEKPQGTNPLNAKIMPLKSHENILVFYRKKPLYVPQMWKSTPYTGFSSDVKALGEVYGSDTKSRHRDNPEGLRYPKTVLRYAQERHGHHPTQKPVPLMEYLISTYTNVGDIVLDPTMGSGTTGVAAKNLKRNFIGIESDVEYFRTAKERIDNS